MAFYTVMEASAGGKGRPAQWPPGFAYRHWCYIRQWASYGFWWLWWIRWIQCKL